MKRQKRHLSQTSVRSCVALFVLVSSLSVAAERTLLWRDPGPIETLNFAAGPEGARNAPVPPFRFVAEETRGISPKLVVLDARGVKWMVKFGEEAKAEIFASRISWAAGYPVRASYYVGKGRIEGISSLKKAARFVGPDGAFQQARFQMFDHERFRENCRRQVGSV